MYTQYFFNFIVLLIVFINLFSIPTTVTSDPRATAASNVICGSGKPTTTSYKSTFVQAMEQLSSNLNNSNSNFATINITNIPSSDNTTTFSFYALFHCHEDLSRTDCLVCYAVSRTAIPACLPRTSGRIFLDGCYVRYDNRSFFQEAVDPDTDTKNCSSNLRSDDWRDFRGGFSEFNQSVRGLVENITNVALNNSGFSAMKYGGVYGLAQCWKSLRNDGCRNCLEKAKNEVKTCMPSRDGRAMNAGCFLRYSTQKFYHTHDEQGNGSNSGISLFTRVNIYLRTLLFYHY
uniref:cysteine-rich receptor-like protein kinase 42 n=1 Tax=Erigeron canadensis TaxID=72917 RepID=UPI001CB94B7B|nr:cysteine-rich receptor-like protein kinase 42 [Erigeron canadensis]